LAAGALTKIAEFTCTW